MTDAVPRLNLAPKLNRPLQLWNPLDYLRLLYWVFYFPQALRWYEGTFVAPENRGVEGKALRQAFMQDAVMRHFVLQALILCFFAAPALAWVIEQTGMPINWLGVGLGAAFGVAFGFALIKPSLGMGIGVTRVITFALTFGVVGGLFFWMSEGRAIGVATGAVAGIAFGLVFNAIPAGAGSMALEYMSLVVAGGLFEGLILGTLFSANNGVVEGMSIGMAFSVAWVVAFLRPDVWAVTTFLSFFSCSASMTACTVLPLPGLSHRLKSWLRCDWSEGVHNINELLAYSMQIIPAVQALNESLDEHPAEQLFLLVDEVSMHPFDWNILRYCSAPLSNELKTAAINGITFFLKNLKQPKMARYTIDIDPCLDTPAYATCAGFWHLHENQSLKAAIAFAVVQKLPHGEEMYSLSLALHIAQSVRDFQSLADLAGREAFLKATTRPSEPALLHPETWQALEHLQRCAQEAHSIQRSVSKAARSWALNRAIGEAVAVQKMIGTVPQAERALVEEIAKNWQSILVLESGEVGNIAISEPVKNPYVAGDPVVGAGFKGREDILRELKQLWSGTTQPPSVVLYGHRRMGKTSILRNLDSHLGSEVRLAYVNLLILGGAERGLSDLFLAIADEIKASLPELPQAEMEEFDRHPELAFKQYLDLAQSALGKSRLIIALDEFEKLEEWMNAGQIPDDLLDTFRGYIQKDQNIAFAFAGLHKLEEMTADYFNPLFASVRPIPVSFLSKDATFQVLANPPLEDFPLDYSREALERIWQFTGGQPYLVQLVGHYLVSRFNRLTFEQGKQLEPVFSLEDVEAVIADPEFYSQGRYYFAGIWGQAGQGAEGQQELLKFIAAFPDGISIDGIAARFGPNSESTVAALKELERHDVLREKDGQWQFTVELMRRWVKEFR